MAGPWHTRWGWEVCYYGHFAWITPVFTFFGLWFYLFPASRCSLTVNQDPTGQSELFIGYWTREDYDTSVYNTPEEDGNACIRWNAASVEDYFDGLWIFGRALSIIGGVSCALMALFNFVLLFMRLSLNLFLPLFIIHLANAIMCLLLLVGLASQVCKNENCKIARGGYIAIAASLWWFFAAYFYRQMWRIERDWVEIPEGVPRKPRQEYEYEYDEEEQPEEEPHSDHLRLPAPEEENSDEEPPPPSRSPRRSTPRSSKPHLALPAPSDNVPRSPRPGAKRNSSKRNSSRSQSPRPSGANLALPPSDGANLALPNSETTSGGTSRSPRPGAKRKSSTRSVNSSVRSPRPTPARKSSRRSVGGDSNAPRSAGRSPRPSKGSSDAPQSARRARSPRSSHSRTSRPSTTGAQRRTMEPAEDLKLALPF